MATFAVVFAFVLGVLLSGGDPGTSVILMPDEDGSVGEISVKTKDDLRVIDKAYHSVTASDKTSRLSETRVLSEAQVTQEYADLLKAQPVKPSSFILYFISGTSELTEESKTIIPQVIAQIKARIPTEVSIIGHTDTTGSDEINLRLSQARARIVEKMLKDSMPSLDRVSVQSFGSKDLLVPTPPNVDEPRNRRVEVMIL